MSKRGWLLGVPWLALALGCGGDDGDKLEGIWLFEGQGKACILEYVFESGEFKESTYCPLDTGPVGIELTSGSYRQSPGRITFTILRSSCPTAMREEVTLGYEVSRSRLTLSTADGNLDLARSRTPAQLSGASVNGCFEADRTFRPKPDPGSVRGRNPGPLFRASDQDRSSWPPASACQDRSACRRSPRSRPCRTGSPRWIEE